MSNACSEDNTTACARLCLCARTRVCITGICGASTALSHCCAELSPSPGCNSNWLNLPGKLRGWLEAPSNYLTVAKPGVKNRFSCSFRLLFCNKAKFCYQKKKEKRSTQPWRIPNLCNPMLPVAHRISNWYILTWYIALDKEVYAFVTAISNHVILLSEAVCSYHVITPFIIRCIYVCIYEIRFPEI